MQRSLLALALSASLLSSTAAGQTLESEVVSNPDSTVTYTVHLDGPPSGLWFSTFSFQSSLMAPWYLPGTLGDFYFNPLTTIFGPTTTLDPSGKGTQSFLFPFEALNHTSIFSQGLVIDSAGQLATTNLSLWYHNTDAGPLEKLNLGSGPCVLLGSAIGQPGTQLRIDHRGAGGALKATNGFTISPEGFVDFHLDVPAHVGYGDLTQVHLNQGGNWQLYREMAWNE